GAQPLPGLADRGAGDPGQPVHGIGVAPPVVGAGLGCSGAGAGRSGGAGLLGAAQLLGEGGAVVAREGLGLEGRQEPRQGSHGVQQARGHATPRTSGAPLGALDQLEEGGDCLAHEGNTHLTQTHVRCQGGDGPSSQWGDQAGSRPVRPITRSSRGAVGGTSTTGPKSPWRASGWSANWPTKPRTTSRVLGSQSYA